MVSSAYGQKSSLNNLAGPTVQQRCLQWLYVWLTKYLLSRDHRHTMVHSHTQDCWLNIPTSFMSCCKIFINLLVAVLLNWGTRRKIVFFFFKWILNHFTEPLFYCSTLLFVGSSPGWQVWKIIVGSLSSSLQQLVYCMYATSRHDLFEVKLMAPWRSIVVLLQIQPHGS